MSNQLLVTLTVEDLKNIIREELETIKPQPTEIFHTITETAKRLKISKGTLATYTKLGLIKDHRISKRTILYRESDIQAALVGLRKT